MTASSARSTHEVRRLRAENAALRDALETLVDLQNGPPLTKYETEWEAAMSAAYKILGRERLDIDTSHQGTGG